MFRLKLEHDSAQNAMQRRNLPRLTIGGTNRLHSNCGPRCSVSGTKEAEDDGLLFGERP